MRRSPPRALADYLPRRLVSEQRALGCAVALGVLALGAVPYEPSVTRSSIRA